MNDLLTALDDDGQGRLGHRGARFLLIRAETLIALQRALEAALGDGAAEVLAAGGRAGGAKATASLAGSVEERVRQLTAMGTKLGWGHFALETLGPDRFVITVRHSAFAEAYGHSPKPVCHLVRGVLESLAATVLARPSRVVESACAATGAPLCRFEASAESAP